MNAGTERNRRSACVDSATSAHNEHNGWIKCLLQLGVDWARFVKDRTSAVCDTRETSESIGNFLKLLYSKSYSLAGIHTQCIKHTHTNLLKYSAVTQLWQWRWEFNYSSLLEDYTRLEHWNISVHSIFLTCIWADWAKNKSLFVNFLYVFG